MKSLSLILCPLVFSVGCGLVPPVKINNKEAASTFPVAANGTDWSGTVTVDLNEITDVKDNVDRIEKVTIKSIHFRVAQTGANHMATIGDSNGRAKTVDGDFPATDDWNVMGIDLTLDNSGGPGQMLDVPAERVTRIRDLVFPGEGMIVPVVIEVTGTADQVPDFTAEVTLMFDAEAKAL